MSLPLQQHSNALDGLDAQHLIPALVLAVCVVWGVAELLSMPRSRKQLDIPRGDWLTVALGAVPVTGVGAAMLWQYLSPPARFNPALVLPSVLLCLAGIGLRTWSKIVLGRFYTFAIDLTEEHRIVTEGPYRFIRHPLYMGTFLAIAGFPLLAQSWAGLWFLTLPTAIVYSVRLFLEEAFLMRSLGADYEAYARRTARLIPFIW